MATPVHPRDALMSGEKGLPVLAPCEHYAGSEALIVKALALQERIGPVFDVTCDCEDGARPGQEQAHADMLVQLLNSPANHWRRAGARLHDPAHPAWRSELQTLVRGAGAALAYLTIPKVASAAQAASAVRAVAAAGRRAGLERDIPVHLLIETPGALAEVAGIAAIPGVETLDFGLMDFVSAHHGAIPASAMRSPGQFEHRLLARAKAEIASAALGHGIVPAHNVTLDLSDPRNAHADARRAREEFGFLRMWSIHPAQIEPIIDGMKPDYSDVQDAAAILVSAQSSGWGPVRYRGEMHDKATYRLYWQLLQRAHSAGVPIPEDAEAAFFAAGG